VSRRARFLVLALAVLAALLVLVAARGFAAVAAAAAVLSAAWLVRTQALAAARAAVSVSMSPEADTEPAGLPYGQMTALLDLFAEGVLLLDGHREVIAANLSAARLLSRPRDAMVGVSLIRAARDHAFLDVLRESAGEPREVAIGDQQVIFATAAAVESGDIRTVLTLQDLTALRRAERARQELVANVSHELRTPIAAALALAETLESGVEDEARRARFHGQLTAEIERLGHIVDRLLRLSRIESRLEEFHPEGLDVAAVLEEARRHLLPVAERAGVTLEVAPNHEQPPLRVHADHDRVQEVLSNLIDNAVRHSPSGGRVTMSARRDADLIEFTVRDHGPGVMPHERARIFERFYTGDRSRADGDGGTGLGLAIARHIVSRHGGEIWVGDDQPGAALCFTLPPARSAPDVTPDGAEAAPDGAG